MSQSQPRNEPVTQQDLEALFLRIPKPEDFELSPQEKRALEDLLAWEKRSAKMHRILGQPTEK